MSAWRPFARYARPEAVGLIALVVLSAAEAALTALTPWPLKVRVDDVLGSSSDPGSRSLTAAAWLAVATVGVVVLLQLALLLKGRAQATVGSRTLYRVAGDTFEHLQRLPMTGRRVTGDEVRRVTADSACARDLLIGTLLPALTSVATLVVMAVVLWLLDPWLTIIAIGAGVPVALLLNRATPALSRRSLDARDLEGAVAASAEQGLSALSLVQAFGREEDEHGRFAGLTGQTVRASLRSTAAEQRLYLATAGVTGVATAVLFGLGGRRVLDGSISLGDLLVFLAYLAALYAPVQALSQVAGAYAESTARRDRVLEVLEAEVEVKDPPRPVRLPPEGLRGDVRLHGVTVGYTPGRPVLTDVDLHARPGQTIALVGRTGAGKSTLAALIPRFFDPWAGHITIDGIDLRHLRLTDLRHHVALVTQEPLLLPTTIADNIAYGRPDATPDQIEAAARAANAHEFIHTLPDGYHSVLGERGATLSGGQRQRLAIARALLKDAPVLVLDEPTAALDAQTEHLLLEALDHLVTNRTTFVIAHRLSTIRNADQIAVLDHGHITHTGTHHQLLHTSPLYQTLHQLQAGVVADR